MKKRRERELMPPKTEKNKSYDTRFTVLGVSFLLICAIFLVYLGATQINGAKYFFPRSDDIIKTETVYGERGRIFDRNGKLLVGNTANYKLIFEYGSMADKRKDVNLALIECLKALNETNTAAYRTDDYFPFIGTYPNMSLSAIVGGVYSLGNRIMLIISEADALHIVINSNKLAYCRIGVKLAPELVFVDKIFAYFICGCVFFKLLLF